MLDKYYTEIVDAQEALDELWAQWFPEKPESATPPKLVWDASDHDVIEKCRSARNAAKFEALYDRDIVV